MSRIFLKVPGSFVLVEQINKKNDPDKEKRRIQEIALRAIDKYFAYNKGEETETSPQFRED